MKKSTFIISVIILIFCSGNIINAQPMKSITIKNATGINITAFYIAPPGSTYWSINLSNRDKIFEGETFSFLQRQDNTACNYDIKILSDDGNTYILKNYDLCTGETVIFYKPDSNGGR